MRYKLVSSSEVRQGVTTADALSADGKMLFDAVCRRELVALVLGSIVPLILFIAYYLGLNRYISKDGIRGLMIPVIGLVGFIFVPTIVSSKKEQLRKFIPVPEKNDVAATIRKLQELNNPDAWCIFHAFCRWSDMCAFFLGMWLGGVLSIAFEHLSDLSLF